MLSWGENTRSGFGLVKPSTINRTNTGNGVDVTYIEHQITHLCAAGNEVVAFIRNDRSVSVARMQGQEGKRNTGKLKSLDTKAKISSLSCGDAHVVLLTVEGRVLYLKNDTSNVPRPLDIFQNRPVTRVACGDQHSLALTRDGQLFTWGQNGRGQLGVGKGEPSTLSPQPLKSLSGIPLAQVSAGGDHSFALSLSGAVFGWGGNAAGQLGLGDAADRHTPVPVAALDLKKTVFISCGEEHTAVLTKGGVVFTFGSGRHGQLGHNSLRDELRPRLVAELWGSKVTQVACGRHHTLALGGSSNKIYSFGRGEQGQLGNGVKMNQSVPLPVQLSYDKMADRRIQSISAGGHHSFALCSSVQGAGRPSRNLGSSPTSIQTLDEAVIERWISGCDSKSWKKIEREISQILSSASCLNGSFLDTSFDKHYQTSKAYSGLDLSLARLAFQKMATKKKVLAKVEQVVRCSLLPSLSERHTAGEDLRVFLILPELLRVLLKKDRVAAGLALAIADALLSLPADKHKALEALWLRLPYPFFRTVVKSFHSVAVKHFQRIVMGNHFDDGKPLEKIIDVMRGLYEVNCNRRIQLAARVFYIEEIKVLLTNMIEASIFLEPEMSVTPLIKQACIFDLEAKCMLFWAEAKCVLAEAKFNAIFSGELRKPLHVSRKTLLQDAIQYFRQCGYIIDLREPLKVKFEEEDGEDHGGVSLMFFTLLAKELLKSDPEILKTNEDSGLTWFTEDRRLTDEFHLLGLMCGMALYNRCLLNVCFPVALFKKLLGRTPTLDDLKELSPVEARGLQQLLEEDEEVVELLSLDFTFKGQELIPNGEDVLVTKVNRQEYVDLYIDMVFNKSVERQYEEFRDGFEGACPLEVWRMFLPVELMTLLHGDDQYEWEELRKNAQYVGYSPTDETIDNFWRVFTEFSEEQKKDFLTFLTGTDRLPRGRHSTLRLVIKLLNKPDPDEYFPEAETCFNALQLPAYSSIAVLRHRLLHAITHCEVIGKF